MVNKKGMGPVEAGIIGAAAGLAVGATVVALSSEKNRKKIGKKINELGKSGQKIYADIKEKVGEISNQAEKKIEAVKKG